MFQAISHDTPIAMLTVGQLMDVINKSVNVNAAIEKQKEEEPAPVLAYGIPGIRNLFGVSHTTAHKYKSTFLKPAIKQNGKKIVIDVKKALELFEQHSKQ